MSELNPRRLRDELLKKIEDGTQKPFGNWPEAVRPHMEQLYKDGPPTTTERDTIDMEAPDELPSSAGLDDIDHDLSVIIEELEARPSHQREATTPPNGFETRITTQILDLLGQAGALIQQLQRLEQDPNLVQFRGEFFETQNLIQREYQALERSGFLKEMETNEERILRDALISRVQNTFKNLERKLRSFETKF